MQHRSCLSSVTDQGDQRISYGSWRRRQFRSAQLFRAGKPTFIIEISPRCRNAFRRFSPRNTWRPRHCYHARKNITRRLKLSFCLSQLSLSCLYTCTVHTIDSSLYMTEYRPTCCACRIECQQCVSDSETSLYRCSRPSAWFAVILLGISREGL